jgi:peptide deformylase
MGPEAGIYSDQLGDALANQEFDNLSAVCHEHEIDQLNGMF